MISSFGDTATADLYHGKDTKAARAIPKDIWPKVRRCLDAVAAAHELRDLNRPGVQLHTLKGDRKGRQSIWINRQYRITFFFKDGQASEVTCGDYH